MHLGSRSCGGTSVAARALALAACLLAPALAGAKNILVIATHPDDEVLMAAGRARVALGNGDTVKIVVVTNGDIGGVTSGLAREDQSITSAEILGFTEDDVIFMGYPDGSMMSIYSAAPGQVITSAAGQTATYADRGLGRTDYHRFLHGVAGPYTRSSVRGDMEALLTNYRPDEIYTHSDYEGHFDHQAVALFVTEALRTLQRSGANLSTKLYQTIVWMPWAGGATATSWPFLPPSGWTPLVPFLPFSAPCVPGNCLDLTGMEWSRVQRFAQPPEMLLTDPATNIKAQAIPAGPSASGGWFGAFVRTHEFFWLKDFGIDLAITATVTASSEDAGSGRQAINAIDGVISGYPTEPPQWVTTGELAGAWIQLSWPAPVRIAQVNLYDRPNTSENILAGTLTFSDGSSVTVGALPPNGRVLPVVFTPRAVSWVRFTVSQAQGTAAGLTEVEVLGALASSTANHPPNIIQGPVPTSDDIPASQSTAVSVVANDIDGDALQYQWSVGSGFVTGTGSTVVFTPPAVSIGTYVPITVNILDGRGGTATNLTYVHVTPAPIDTLTLSPALVFGGDPSQGTLVLGTAAPAGGVVVPLSTNDPSAAVPASVTVPAGASTATFPITTASVATSTTATVTATLAGGPRSASLTLAPRAVTALLLIPTNVQGGFPAGGAVTLPAPAGAQGVVVQLSSTDSAHASVPSSVTVPAGATSATFSITTSSVQAATNVTITATYGTSTTAVLTVSPLAMSLLSLDPASVMGGGTSQGTVVLNGPAPSGGAIVSLSSDTPSVAAVPATVTVAAGSNGAVFTIATATVPTATAPTISATYGGTRLTATLTVTPVPPNPNLLANPEQIGGASWDAFGDLAMTLNYAVAPDGSSHASRGTSTGNGHALRQVVTVIPGTTYTFSFFARNHGGTGASLSVYDYTHGGNIVAPSSYFSQLNVATFARVGVTFTVPAGCTSIGVYPLRDSGAPVDVLLWGAKLEVGPTMTPYQGLAPAALSSLTLGQGSVTGGGSVTGTVVLTAPVNMATVIALASDDTEAASVPAGVTVAAGSSSATFTTTTFATDQTTAVHISATLGTVTRTASLTVAAPVVSTVAVSPTSVQGGVGATGTVTLSGPAAFGGVLVTLTSSSPLVASVPEGVSIPGGATSATFPVTTAAVTSPVAITITAQYGATATASLTVSALAVSALSVTPASVVGGTTAQGTLTLNGLAGAGGAVVALSSSAPAVASVPATVTVPAGATSTTFSVSTVATSTSTPVTLSATMGGATATTTLTVGPQPTNPNLLSAPEQVGQAGVWDVWGNLTATLNFATAPDGTQHASRFTSNGLGHALRQLASVTPGATYTLSFYVQNNGGSAASYSVYDAAHGAEFVRPTSYFAQINGSSFTRVHVTFTAPSGCNLVGVYPLRDSGGPVNVLLWGVKLEVGPNMTPY